MGKQISATIYFIIISFGAVFSQHPMKMKTDSLFNILAEKHKTMSSLAILKSRDIPVKLPLNLHLKQKENKILTNESEKQKTTPISDFFKTRPTRKLTMNRNSIKSSSL